MNIKDIDYSNSQMSALIDEYIHNQKYRDILKYRFIDGLTYEAIAEKVDMSPQHIKTIIYKAQNKLLSHL